MPSLALAGARGRRQALAPWRPLAVRPGAEARAAAPEHHHARLEVALQTVEEIGELLERRGVERVAPLRSVEPDPQQRALALERKRARLRSLRPYA
jgi:hypothetical protein